MLNQQTMIYNHKPSVCSLLCIRVMTARCQSSQEDIAIGSGWFNPQNVLKSYPWHPPPQKPQLGSCSDYSHATGCQTWWSWTTGRIGWRPFSRHSSPLWASDRPRQPRFTRPIMAKQSEQSARQKRPWGRWAQVICKTK